MLKVYQFKTSDGSIRTDIDFEEFKIKLINDQVIEAKDFRKQLMPVCWKWGKNKQGGKVLLEKKIVYSTPDYGFDL